MNQFSSKKLFLMHNTIQFITRNVNENKKTGLIPSLFEEIRPVRLFFRSCLHRSGKSPDGYDRLVIGAAVIRNPGGRALRFHDTAISVLDRHVTAVHDHIPGPRLREGGYGFAQTCPFSGSRVLAVIISRIRQNLVHKMGTVNAVRQ